MKKNASLGSTVVYEAMYTTNWGYIHIENWSQIFVLATGSGRSELHFPHSQIGHFRCPKRNKDLYFRNRLTITDRLAKSEYFFWIGQVVRTHVICT